MSDDAVTQPFHLRRSRPRKSSSLNLPGELRWYRRNCLLRSKELLLCVGKDRPWKAMASSSRGVVESDRQYERYKSRSGSFVATLLNPQSQPLQA